MNYINLLVVPGSIHRHKAKGATEKDHRLSSRRRMDSNGNPVGGSIIMIMVLVLPCTTIYCYKLPSFHHLLRRLLNQSHQEGRRRKRDGDRYAFI